MPPLFDNKVHRTAPAGLSKVQVDRLRAGDGLMQIPWFKDGYVTHVDHFCGKNGVHQDTLPTIGQGPCSVMNCYWILSPHQEQDLGLTGLRPSDAGTVVKLCGNTAYAEEETPGFIWSFLNQYRYGTLHAWYTRLYPLSRNQEEQQNSRLFHGLIRGVPADSYESGLLEQAARPFAWVTPALAAMDCIGFKYDYVDDPDNWHVLIRNGQTVIDAQINVAFELCEWVNFLITKDTDGNLYFWANIEDGNGWKLMYTVAKTNAAIPTNFMAEIHYADTGTGGDESQTESCAVIDVSAIVCKDETVTLCQQQ